MKINKFQKVKIIIFQGGLGNQIFQYAFYKYLSEKFPDIKIFGYYSSKSLTMQHNGLEINKIFNIILPPENFWVKTLVKITNGLRKIKLAPNLYSSDDDFNINSCIFSGFWQDQKYYRNLNFSLEFLDFNLSETNKDILKKITELNSVSIHIRRGDYLSEKHSNIYGNICTLDYYKHAIKLISSKLENITFFIFSDDIDWAESNLRLKNSVYITWNKNINSYLDMYLMSKCKANIIANSSFSYWASYLNKNTQQIVIYPKKWYNSVYKTPDIFPDTWVGI